MGMKLLIDEMKKVYGRKTNVLVRLKNLKKNL